MEDKQMPLGNPPEYTDSAPYDNHQGMPMAQPLPPHLGQGDPGVGMLNVPPHPYPTPQDNPPQYSGAPQVTMATTHTTVVIHDGGFGDAPRTYNCHRCNASVVTVVTRRHAASSYILCTLICLLGGWLGCCLIPFCCKGLTTAVHKCPQCKITLGKSK